MADTDIYTGKRKLWSSRNSIKLTLSNSTQIQVI